MAYTTTPLVGYWPGPSAIDRLRWRITAGWGGLLLTGLVVTPGLVGLGWVTPSWRGGSLGIGAVLVIAALAATDPRSVGILVVLGVWVIQRVAVGGVDLSGSDAVLILGALVLLPFAPWANTRFRRLLGLVACFQGLLLLVVVVHPTAVGLVEWGHRLFLLAGSLVVGGALATTGRVATALRAFLAVAVLVAVAAMVTAFARGFTPGPTLWFHKNFVGSMMVTAVVVTRLAPGAVRLPRGAPTALSGVFLAGLAASQSRGAVLALLVALVLIAVFQPCTRRRVAALLVPLTILGAVALLSLRTDIAELEGATNSLTERERFGAQAMDLWRESPLFGQGVRFFTTGQFELASDPHNVLYTSLSESGVVGLGGLVLLVVGAGIVVGRVGTPLGAAALAVLVARATHGVFDIFWVASTQALPWILCGMAVAARRPEEEAGDG